MKTKVSTVKGTKEGKVQTVKALADSGASIISWYLAKKVNMMIFEKGDATLKDASHKNIDVSGRGDIMVQEEHGIQHKIKVLVSTDFSQDEKVVGLEDQKVFGILHIEFPKKHSLKEKENMQNSSVSSTTALEETNGMHRWQAKEKREKGREVLLYLEERAG